MSTSARPGETKRPNTLNYGPLILLVLLAAFLVRVYRIADPFGGYHSFNEAHYTLQGIEYLARSIGDFIVNPVDTNNPPLFGFLLYVVFKIFGVSEATSRFVPVAFSLVAVYFTYLLGVLLYNRRVGILAALFTALMPGFVLVTRNAQPEAVYTAFILISLYLFIRGGADSVGWAAAAGFVFGLGLLTKAPTVVILPALIGWHVWRSRRLSWPTLRPLAVYVAAALIAMLPYYGYQIVFNSQEFFESQGKLAGTISVPSPQIALALITDFFWLLSPMLFAGLLISIIWLSLKRSKADIFILLAIVSYLGFFFFYHFHSYYVIPVAPFVALGIGRFLDSTLRSDRIVFGTAIGSTLVLICFTFLMLAGAKYGRTELKDVASFVPRDTKIIETQDIIKGNFGAVFEYYLPDAELRVDPPDQYPTDKKFYVVLPRNEELYQQAAGQSPDFYLSTIEVNRLVIFGYTLRQDPPNDHSFTSGPIEIAKADPPRLFGWERTTEPWWLVTIDPTAARGGN